MEKYCSNCGNELKENADVCLKCGKLLNVKNNNSTNKKGTGLSIASMVLGIIVTFFAIIELLAIEQAVYDLLLYTKLASIIGYLIGYTLFSLPGSITGLCLGLSGRKKYKSGFNLSGIILNSISLTITFIIILYLIFSII